MVRAELLKLTTTTAPRAAVAIGGAGLVLTQLVFVTVIPALASGRIGPGAEALGGDLPPLDLSTAASQLAALSPFGASGGGTSIGIAVIAIVLMGVLAGTSDYRFGGIVSTALAQPNRIRILLAKAAATGIAGLVTGAVFAVLSLATLLGTLAFAGIPVALEPAVIAAVFTRSVLAVAFLALIGLSVGILAQNQLTGVLAILAILLLEPILQSIVQLAMGGLPLWAALMPLSLANAVIGAEQTALPLPLAAAALIGLTAVTLTLAAAALRRRDIP